MLRKKLEELIAFAKATDLQEVVWEKKGTLISFHRSPVVDAPRPTASPEAAAGAGEIPPPAGPPVIRSTMVGTFYRSDSPDRPPFVVEGTVVAAGQPVAAIEAMKIMKDVVAPVPCRIVKALVANGHPVEYGQSLFEVESAAENV